MSAKSSRASIYNTSTETTETTKIAKLRRLKMQEKLLFNNISLNIESHDIQQMVFTENKRYSNSLLAEVKKKYQDIKSLLNEVKYNAENVGNIDLEQVKRDVLTLEDNITDFKTLLKREINNLRTEEEKILLQINDEVIHRPLTKTVTRMKTLIDIVPSPVKNIINTPYKYKEVQKLHEFLKSNGGKYGGWHEFNHNLFVYCRQKYLQNLSIDNESISYHNALTLLVKELLVKIIGTTSEKIIEHEKWYIKYLELKSAQEEVMKRWRQSRNHTKRSHITEDKKGKRNNDSYNLSEGNNLSSFQKENIFSGSNEEINLNIDYADNDNETVDFNTKNKCFKVTKNNKLNKHEQNMKITKMQNKSTLFQPTEVWKNKVFKGKINNETNINNWYQSDCSIWKYGTPKWRQCLT